MSVFSFDCTIGLKPVESMEEIFLHAITKGHFMDPSRMRPDEILTCQWVEYGMSKGVTHLTKDLTIVADCAELPRGLHADLVAEFSDEVDPYPLCYEPTHQRGFGGFIRWLAFTNPRSPEAPGIFGIDFSTNCRPTSGVANTVWRVAEVARIILSHGIDPRTEIAMLNSRMTEDIGVTAWREHFGLRTVKDWVDCSFKLLFPNGYLCPRCGCHTFFGAELFCSNCGYNLKQKRM